MLNIQADAYYTVENLPTTTLSRFKVHTVRMRP